MAARDGADHDDRQRRAGADPRAARVGRPEGPGRAGAAGPAARRSSPSSSREVACVDGGWACHREPASRRRVARGGPRRVRARRPSAARRARRARRAAASCSPTPTRFADDLVALAHVVVLDGADAVAALDAELGAGRGAPTGRRAAALAVVAVVGPAGPPSRLAGRGGRGTRRSACPGRGDPLRPRARRGDAAGRGRPAGRAAGPEPGHGRPAGAPGRAREPARPRCSTTGPRPRS